MNEDDLKERTKQFALDILKLCSEIPNTIEGRAVRGQLVRAGTSVGSNYRAACRGRSKPEFVAKLGIVEEEADECAFWLEILIESNMLPERRVERLMKESNELTAIMAASRKTSIANQSRSLKRSKVLHIPIANQNSQIPNPQCSNPGTKS